MILAIAWRNIWRKKIRSLVVIFAVSLGLYGALFSLAFSLGMFEQRIQSAIKYEISHIQIHHPKFNDNKEIIYAINSTDSILGYLNSNPDIEAAAERIKCLAMAQSARAAKGVIILGIVPEKEKNITLIHSKILDRCGTYFLENKENFLVIGAKLMKELKLKYRSKVTFTLQDIEGNMINVAFRINGVFETSNPVFDETTVFVNKKTLGELVKMKPNQSHEIAIILKDSKNLEVATTQIQNNLAQLEVAHWKSIQPDLGMGADMMDMMMYIILIILLAAMAFGIINTMLMAVLERTRELGMLIAIGMNRRKIFSMVMLETVLLSLVGGIIGMVLSFVTITYFGIYGLEISYLTEGFNAYGFENIIYTHLEWYQYVILTFLIIITGLASSISPAIKALKINPATAVRAE